MLRFLLYSSKAREGAFSIGGMRDILIVWDMSVHEEVMSGNGVLFLGWFGPIGAAALYYAAFSLRETGIGEVWAVGSLVICASVMVHGVTGTPLTKLYGRLIQDE